jgi:hypothetical protein
VTAEHADESRKPPIEVIVGSERVMQYIVADSRLGKLIGLVPF